MKKRTQKTDGKVYMEMEFDKVLWRDFTECAKGQGRNPFNECAAMLERAVKDRTEFKKFKDGLKKRKKLSVKQSNENLWGKWFARECAKRGLLPVETFHRKTSDRSSYVAINDGGECFVGVTPGDAKMQRVTLAEAVRFWANEQRHSYEGTNNPENRRRFIAMAAKALTAPKGCYTITLTPAMSRDWDAISKRFGIPVDWMINDELASSAREYLSDWSGYGKDSKVNWKAERKNKVPIKVVKGGAK